MDFLQAKEALSKIHLNIKAVRSKADGLDARRAEIAANLEKAEDALRAAREAKGNALDAFTFRPYRGSRSKGRAPPIHSMRQRRPAPTWTRCLPRSMRQG